jgi:pimeloyl-ACP methyl ester carboxylesterase
MATLRKEHVDVDGRDTAYLTGGEGEPLVFFHGGGIVEGFECFEPLADDFRFVAPFHPGFGGTALDPAPSSVDQIVQGYDRLFDELGFGEIALSGHSLGGWIAARYAAAHPDRVRRLVIASPYGLDVPGHPLAAVWQFTPAELYAALTNDPSVWIGRVPDPITEEFQAARALEGQSVGGFVPGPFDPELPDKLQRLTMPTLLLWGDEDKIVPVGHLPAWESQLPSSRTQVFEHTGHLLFHEKPEAVEAIGAHSSGS